MSEKAYDELRKFIEKYGYEEVMRMVNSLYEEYEEVEAYEEPYDECGFDPYMGCYSYDC